jgi:predicted GNAT family acetyltransferase
VTPSPTLRILQPGDERALDLFLARHADSSMFLRSNARAAGLVDRGEPMQGTYVAALEDGTIVAVAAHCWNGVVLVQAPVHLAALVRAAVERTARTITGVSGPWPQVTAALAALGLAGRAAAKHSREDLYTLELRDLRIPPILAEGAVRCRHATEAELPLLVEWRTAFVVEALGGSASPEQRAACLDELRLLHARGCAWVLVRGPTAVSHCVFNARLPDIVQIGAVWTPPALRGRGYARAVVAGALRAARTEGASRAVLFAEPANAAARTAYVALGFQRIGDYGLVLFDPR